MDQAREVIEPHSCGYPVQIPDVSYVSNHHCAVTDIMNSCSASTSEHLTSLPTKYSSIANLFNSQLMKEILHKIKENVQLFKLLVTSDIILFLLERRPRKGRELLDLIANTADILPKQRVLDTVNRLPDILRELLTSSSEEAKAFRELIRTYNNQYGVTSFGVKCNRDLCTNMQLYFHDIENEVSNRLAACPRLSESVIKKLITVFQHNPYARFFRNLCHIPNLDSYKIVLHTLPGLDQRVYNKPTESQVAALWVEGEENGENSRRNRQVYTCGGSPRNIQYYYGCYDPLQYPLMFPFGELGWHQGIAKKGIKTRNRKQKTKNASAEMIAPATALSADQLLYNEEIAMHGLEEDPTFVSLREYYAYKLQIRDSNESLLLHFCRLFQQYVVDGYVKIEKQKLDFFRSQQEEIRREFLNGIMDAVAARETHGSNIGQRIILPPGFIGGPKNMRRRYMDAMTLVQKFEKPDLFLTMTCNPNWPEIKEHLIAADETQNRPDLISRVFHAKLEKLKDELFKKHIFGEIAAYTYVIENQKRGMRHAHFLLILKSKYKLYTADEYDKIVCAEIPDKKKFPHLYKMVVKHIHHGPCGSANPQNVCMKKNGFCKNSYPKEFCNATIQVADAYPKYRRRDNGIKVKVRNVWLNNRWVVPYSAYLLAKIDCHINIDICSTVKAIKYIYKYICKGHDRTSFRVVADSPHCEIDKIKQYVSARWISPPEATWRIYRFPTSEIKPAVIHLQLHLENQQPMSFKKNTDLPNVVNNGQLRKTMLTEFFYVNRMNKEVEDLNYTYVEFSEHFVWSPSQRMWKICEQRDSIGRIVVAHPGKGERYYLRLLLTKVRCPTSFADLRTFAEVQVQTFREAALLRGLLEDDNSQELCLQEASHFHIPYEMRRLFATLLVYSSPNNPPSLWSKFEDVMSEDFLRCKTLTASQVRTKVLDQINGFLQSMGKNISSFNLYPLDFSMDDMESQTRELNAERNISVAAADLDTCALLNQKQKEAFNVICEKVYTNKSGAFFVDGPGGTGKTFLYHALLADIRSKGHVALATATSGIAASILPGGRTAHSRFKISIDISDGGTCRISKQSSLVTLIKESKLIIWDETPMSKRAAIEALDDMLRDIMNSNKIFGEKVVVFGGDFRQTLLIVRSGTKAETINACFINSSLWPHLQKLQLTENMRAKSNPLFTQFILEVGNGLEQLHNTDLVVIPSSIMIKYTNEVDSLERLKDAVYPDINTISENAALSLNRAILTTKNHFAEYGDFLNTLSPSGLPPHKLVLKPHAPIILLRNLDPTEGLCNGTRLICKSLTKNVIHAEIAVGHFAGKKVFIHRIPLQPTNDDQYPVPYKRTQFPVRLCFTMTINKSQEQTLDFVGLYLKEHVFSQGQLYVALSRAKTSNAIRVLIKPEYFSLDDIDCIKNIAYREILDHSCYDRMSRRLFDILDINKQTGPWTVLVQVVERGNVHVARTAPYKKFRRFLLTDSQISTPVSGTQQYLNSSRVK
ncbi:uncharacterized protein [Coffea arabica]|uniref:ATP-dependent DNA helicase n=1 Tax=Coffea arabica TaxID=13443 RepID=A0A6P6TEC8_COFAR|nr:uncharacterized protein LOC113700523 [Coffea arabica]